MKRRGQRLVCILILLGLNSAAACSQEPVSFNRDVRPILTSNCFACHGPDDDQRESDLRLDKRESAVESEAIVPGRPDESSLVARVFSTDSDEVMPPASTGHELTLAEKQTLKQWIEEGAKYESHWAFEPLQTASPPTLDSEWPRNGIDQFVFQELAKNQLTPAEEADRYTLVRRVYLDLIGLPPTVDQADEFVNSTDPLAYQKLVDQLLSSKHYGERWAQPWLDLARYSDTNGYEKDRERSIWPYRDWVIRALNEDMPYDQFSIEQIAGDMLLAPTADQLIATGFHRNTMLNEEGGIDPLEYRFLAMVDRVATTGTVWMGLTTGCAQCHTHKYDPISHTDYYQLMALMNNADEPDFRIPDAAKQQQIDNARESVLQMESDLATKLEPLAGAERNRQSNRFETEFEKWIEETGPQAVKWNVIRPSAMKTNLPKLEVLDDGSIFSTGDTTKRDLFELTFDLDATTSVNAIRLEALPDSRLPDFGPGRTYYEGRKGDFFVSEVTATLNGQPLEFASASHDFSDPAESDDKKTSENVFDGDGSTGWQPGAHKSVRLKLVLNLKTPIETSGQLTIKLLFERHYTVSLGRFRFSTTDNPNATANRLDEEVEDLLASRIPTADSPKINWSPIELKKLKRAFLMNTPILADARKELKAAVKATPMLDETMVLRERPADNPRKTYRHHRGEYLSPKEKVSPGLPDMFADSLEPSQRPTNRLEFARWLVSDSNPLAARVAVNRAWRELFGAGLVRTDGDFGVQSEPPAYPELLDWLAVQFRDQFKWSTKDLHRLIVTSSTYRQSSSGKPEMIQRDPDNQLLARGPSFRVSGEQVRDIALTATGSLSTKMFGPGVHPPQPASVTELAYGATPWSPSTGPDRFRRSLYTFRKRTASFAAYSVFDAPSGEVCTAKRNRSNTPLQALTTLNDEMYLELTQRMARQTVEQNFESDSAAIIWIFRSFLTRPPSESEITNLESYFVDQLTRLEAGQLDAVLIGGNDATARQAAFAMLARVIMNLDETITKR